MAQRLATLPAMQVAWVRFPIPSRPTFSVKKWLFYVNLRPGDVASTAIALYNWIEKLQSQVVCGDLRLDCLCRPGLLLGLTLKSKQSKAKVSHLLRPGNTAFKEQLKLVNSFER
jgi:hypothetical protein